MMNRQIKKERTDRKSLGLGSGHKGFRFRHLPLALLVVGILFATLQYITLHRNVGFNPARIGIKIPAQSVSEQYLYYFTYAGWSNQLMGLYHAAQLAYSTNRTLIVPPILSHHSTDDMGNARGGNFALRCGPDHLDYVKFDAEECLKSPEESSHVKFSEIINMTQLSQSINVPFTDLCDFVKEEPALAKKYFFRSKKQMKPEQSTIDLSGRCALKCDAGACKGPLRSYTEMVEHFKTIFGRDDAVAIIPSAFILHNSNSHSKDFRLNVFSYPPTSNLLGILRILRNRLPTNYIGVHLRYRDDVDWADDDEIAFQCSGKMAGKAEVLDMIRHGHLTMIEQNKAAANSTPSVYFASNSQEAMKCYKQFFSDEGVQAFSLNDLLARERNSTREFFSAIKASKSTIHLNLDQILVSLGQQLALRSKERASSFQHAIEVRHEREHDIINS